MRRDAAEILTGKIPQPIRYVSHREFVREVLREEVTLRARGPEFVRREPSDSPSVAYRNHMNADGSPSETVAAGWIWHPGTELASHANGRAKERRAAASRG